jgi:hypothetical protein
VGRVFVAVDLATCRQTSLPADPERPIMGADGLSLLLRGDYGPG